MSDLQLETPRLCLRLMRSPDLDDLLKIFGDPKVMASLCRATFNREQRVSPIENMQLMVIPIPMVRAD